MRAPGPCSIWELDLRGNADDQVTRRNRTVGNLRVKETLNNAKEEEHSLRTGGTGKKASHRSVFGRLIARRYAKAGNQNVGKGDRLSGVTAEFSALMRFTLTGEVFGRLRTGPALEVLSLDGSWKRQGPGLKQVSPVSGMDPFEWHVL